MILKVGRCSDYTSGEHGSSWVHRSAIDGDRSIPLLDPYWHARILQGFGKLSLSLSFAISLYLDLSLSLFSRSLFIYRFLSRYPCFLSFVHTLSLSISLSLPFSQVISLSGSLSLPLSLDYLSRIFSHSLSLSLSLSFSISLFFARVFFSNSR